MKVARGRGLPLWERVFFWALALTVLTVLFTSQLVIQLNFRQSVTAETERSRLEHSLLSAQVSARLAYEKNRAEAPFLGREGAESALLEAAAGQAGKGGGMAVYWEGRRVAAANLFLEPRAGQLLESLRVSPLGPEELRTVICREQGRYFTVSVSLFTVEQLSYELFTLRNITALYENRDAMTATVQLVLLGFTLLMALVLYLVVRRLLAPLSRVSGGIGKMASGDYGLRLPEQGPAEFRQLSRNVNTLARSVEENLERVQSLADGRKRFIDNLTHEMKTPLTSILGFGDLLRVKRSVTEEQRREYAGVIVEEAKRLQSLSGKLMELISAQNTGLDCREMEIPTLFQEISLSVSPQLARRGLRFLCTGAKGTLWADQELVKSLLYNLIDNAAKASKEGDEVQLSCTRGEKGVVFSVSDWGIGMDEKTLRRASEPFYMADKSRSRKNGGAGLGLALCQKIAELHGGWMRLKSQPGRGTTVFVMLPGSPPAASEEPSLPLPGEGEGEENRPRKRRPSKGKAGIP